MIEDAGDDGVNNIENGFGTVIEGGNGRDDVGAGFEDGDDVAGLDEVPGRFPRDEDEFPLLLEEDVRRADDGAVGITVGDPAQRAHGAGDDDHGVESRGAADVGDLHGCITMNWEGRRNGQLAGLGFGDLAGVGTEGNVDFVRPARVIMKKLKQPLGVKRAAGSRDGHDEFHYPQHIPNGGRTKTQRRDANRLFAR